MKQKRVNPKILITLIIVVGLVVLGLIATSSLGSSSTVSATGTATIKAKPDFATVYFDVQTTGENSSEASQKNSEIVGEAKSSLKDLGFNASQITTENYNLRPEYDYGRDKERKITGYVASHTLKVEIPIEEKEKIGQAVDAGVNAGAGVSHINFELGKKRQSELKTEAIKKATEDAKEKAEALAEGSGNRLGELKSLSSSNFDYRPWVAYESRG
ncbi:MAG: SIMPL domain-containing protein, partial [Candidatus Pacearchaeota archaeon]